MRSGALARRIRIGAAVVVVTASLGTVAGVDAAASASPSYAGRAASFRHLPSPRPVSRDEVADPPASQDPAAATDQVGTTSSMARAASDLDASQCGGARYEPMADDAQDAQAILDGWVPIPRYADYKAPSTGLTWREDPYRNTNWVFELQSLRWLDPLRRTWLTDTSNTALRDKYIELWHDWLTANPPRHPRSSFSWYDMAVGVRGIGLSCLASVLDTTSDPRPAWFQQAVADHVAALTDPKQYKVVGNHALHQNMGLLALGCTFSQLSGSSSWRSLALSRGLTLLERSVDSQGVTDEGSIGYESLNYTWYSEFRQRIQECGYTPSSQFSRISLMPSFLAQATQPNRTVVPFGDSNAITGAPLYPGTPTEYATSLGASGTKPSRTTSTYRNRGYAFSRSGWFDTEPAAQQSLLGLRFGPSLSTAVHGHMDAGAVSFFGYGRQLLWQPGVYGGGGGAPRTYVRSNEAHSTMDVPGLVYDLFGTTPLSVARTSSQADLFTTRSNVLHGASWTRTVIHLKKAHALLVDDLVTQTRKRSAVQRWQLGTGRSVLLRGNRAVVTGSGANVSVLWLKKPQRIDVARGRHSPSMLGWISEAVNRFVPASTLEAWGTGKSVRIAALVVARPAGASATAAHVVSSSTSHGRTVVTVDTGHGRWRVIYTRSSVSAVQLH